MKSQVEIFSFTINGNHLWCGKDGNELLVYKEKPEWKKTTAIVEIRDINYDSFTINTVINPFANLIKNRIYMSNIIIESLKICKINRQAIKKIHVSPITNHEHNNTCENVRSDIIKKYMDDFKKFLKICESEEGALFGEKLGKKVEAETNSQMKSISPLVKLIYNFAREERKTVKNITYCENPSDGFTAELENKKKCVLL